jgi:hypothetical protein
MRSAGYMDLSAGNVKVKDFAAKWMSAQGHLKPSTRATYESIQSKHVLPRWGSTPVSKVTPPLASATIPATSVTPPRTEASTT